MLETGSQMLVGQPSQPNWKVLGLLRGSRGKRWKPIDLCSLSTSTHEHTQIGKGLRLGVGVTTHICTCEAGARGVLYIWDQLGLQIRIPSQITKGEKTNKKWKYNKYVCVCFWKYLESWVMNSCKDRYRSMWICSSGASVPRCQEDTKFLVFPGQLAWHMQQRTRRLSGRWEPAPKTVP